MAHSTKHFVRTLHLRTGSEGPRHDPYHFDEYTVSTPEFTVTAHMGLGSSLSIDGEEVTRDEADVVEHFERLTGIPLRKFAKYYERVHPYFEDPMGSPSMYE